MLTAEISSNVMNECVLHAGHDVIGAQLFMDQSKYKQTVPMNTNAHMLLDSGKIQVKSHVH